jgi:lipoyl(octanoyl) transferase
LEEVVLATCQRYGIYGKHVDRKPGVWLTDKWQRERKIAAVGVAVSHWVTYHGLALNVNTDLAYFQLINPCGYASETMTSMADQVGQRIVFDEVKEAFTDAFAEQFGAQLEAADPAQVADGWPSGAQVASVDEEPPTRSPSHASHAL